MGLTPLENYALIFLSKVVLVVFGLRSFEHYMKGNVWTTSITDTVFFVVAIWSQRIIVADKSNPALVSATAGIFVGTFIAAHLRKRNELKDKKC